MDIVAYGFNKDVHVFLRPESANVLKKLWCLKMAGLDQTDFMEREFPAYEDAKFGKHDHIKTRYSKQLKKWLKQ